MNYDNDATQPIPAHKGETARQPVQYVVATPKKSHKLRNWLLAMLPVVVLLAVCGGMLNSLNDTSKKLDGLGSVDRPVATDSAAPTKAAVAKPKAYMPTVKDFKLSVKVLKKQCFGSAGCNIEYRLNVAYAGQPLAGDVQYEVTYRVTGGDDGVQDNTFMMVGTVAQVDETEYGSLKRSSDKLKVVATSVEKFSL